MRSLCFNTKAYDIHALEQANRSFGHQLSFSEARLNPMTAALAEGYQAVTAFVNDDLGAETLQVLAQQGVKYIALRSAGYNQLNLQAASKLGLKVARVPAYSPYAVAEHALALILTLNRKTHRAYQRVREQNFALDGLLGFDLHGKTLAVIGTGTIGKVFCRILSGFGCRILALDPVQDPECLALGVEYLGLEALCQQADIISLHCPLLPQTYHLINQSAIEQMKDGVMLINTSRGGLIDTSAVIKGLKSGKIGYLGLDVYEEEGELFFQDLSQAIIQDDVFSRLLTFPNVLITGHQAYFTQEALQNIARTTLQNLSEFEEHGSCANQLEPC